MKELDVKAEKTALPRVLGLIDEQLEANECSMKLMTQIDLAAEEIFTNIASYAYEGEAGDVLIRVDISGEPECVTISFTDSGRQYDPLSVPEPEKNKLPLKERKKGGLGVFLVRKNMDEVRYEYKDGKNILTMTKKIK